MLNMRRPRRLISIAHSYAVALNRRLAHEMARLGGRDWEVTAVAPSLFQGELRPIPLERLEQEPCRLEALPTYCQKWIHGMVYGFGLRQLLGASWDVVHCWEEPFVFAGGQVAGWTSRRSVLVLTTFQNLTKHYPPPFQWIERYALGRAAGWIAGGSTIVQALTQKACYQKRRRCIIPLGVDVDHFRPDSKSGEQVRRELGWSSAGPPVVGYLGRFVPEKGLQTLIRALGQVTGPWRALLVGGGPMEGSLREWARLQGDQVRIVTGIKHDRVPAFLNAMDVLCAPSQTMPHWREQLGRMVIEAFACGVPVIASDSGEIPHVISDAGVIVGEKDFLGWVKSLAELLDNPLCRVELGQRGRERAQAVYSWSKIARSHLDFFTELLESQAEPGLTRAA